MPTGLAICGEEVVMVVKGSWGANQGIEQGDVIVSVNGKKVSAMKDLAERRALMEDPATELTFQFQRPAERVYPSLLFVLLPVGCGSCLCLLIFTEYPPPPPRPVLHYAAKLV